MPVTKEQLKDIFTKLLESKDELEQIIGKVLLGKSLDKQDWKVLAAKALDLAEERLPAKDELSRALVTKARALMEDGVLTGDDFVVLALVFATRNSLPGWVINIVEHGLAGSLDRKDFTEPFEEFIEKHVGVDGALIVKSLLADGEVSKFNWQTVVSIALFRFGLLKAPKNEVDRDSIIEALTKAMAGKNAALATTLKGLVNDLDTGKNMDAFRKVLDLAGVSGLPEILESILSGAGLETAFVDQVTSWLDQGNGGAAGNGALAQAMVDVLLGKSKIFSVDSDKDSWRKALVLGGTNESRMYPRIQRLRKAVFAAHMIESKGSFISTSADAAPLLLGLWSKPDDKLKDLVGDQDAVTRLRVILQAEFFTELVKDSHGNAMTPALFPSSTMGQTMLELDNLMDR